MPQVQVLSRQQDTAVDTLPNVASSITQSLQQQQAMKLTLLELKQKIKATDNEQEAAKWKRTHDVLDYAFKLKEAGADPTMAMKLLGDYGKDDLWPALNHGGKRMGELQALLEDVKKSPGTGEQQKDRAQADIMNSPRMRGSFGLPPSGVQQMAPQQSMMPDQSGGLPPNQQSNQDRAEAMGSEGNMVMPELDFGMGKMVDLNAIGQIEETKQLAGDRAKKKGNLTDYQRALSQFLEYEQDLPRTPRGKEGLWSTINQVGKFQAGKISQTNDGLYKNYYDSAQELEGFLARRKDVGNLSSYEQKNARKLVPLQEDSDAIRDRKVGYLIQISRLPDTEDTAAIREVLDQAINELGLDKSPRGKFMQQQNQRSGQSQQQVDPNLDAQINQMLDSLGAQ